MADQMSHISKSLDCPICLQTFEVPKLLECGHTFCRNCVENLWQCRYHRVNELSCPVCRATTKLPNGSVSKLPPNITVRGLVHDMKDSQRSSSKFCTICKGDDQSSSVAYCHECNDFLCHSCLDTHTKWKKFAGHQITAIEDILAGKTVIERQPRKCEKHPPEVEEFFCTDCQKYVCFRCRVLEHGEPEHHVIEGKEHQRLITRNIQRLTHQVENRIEDIGRTVDFLTERIEVLQTNRKDLDKKVNLAFEEAVEQLEESRKSLLVDIEEQSNGMQKKLEEVRAVNEKVIGCMSRTRGLVEKGMNVSLESEALTTHLTLCSELQALLMKDHLDKVLSNASTCSTLDFLKVIDNDTLVLGKLELKGTVPQSRRDVTRREERCVLVKDLEVRKCSHLTSLPNGSIAVGCYSGGADIYSPDGKERTVLNYVKIQALAVLSDGRFVVLDTNNQLRLYRDKVELNVQFETLSRDEGGYGCVAVDHDDDILVSYRRAKIIHIFLGLQKGGRPVREIVLDSIEPWQIHALNSSRAVVVTNVIQSTVKVVDERGTPVNAKCKIGIYPFTTVCRDDTILIAWAKVRDGFISVDRYSHDLRYLETLVQNQKVDFSGWIWAYLTEFATGEIAFCTESRLYIFRKIVVNQGIGEGENVE